MNDNKTVDASVVMVGLALGFFLAVIIVIIGGWFFAWAWGAFMVPVFALPAIEVAEGIAAMLLLYLSGFALGLRRSHKVK